ncbi:MAG: serine hydroxymethyltransferase [Epsilonproteobacteria bacterium]|nr:serine hydroxymethyltransferase [Campylobacterota bacterium]
MKDFSGYLETLISRERIRQESEINLIASENYASERVMSASGSVLTNKYAEGYPGKRYYGGCHVVDEVESHALDLVNRLFGSEYANVQSHSGSSANWAVYFSFLKPGDTVLGMDLGAGGHLTHGHPVNFSGKYFNFISYGVDQETEQLDYDGIARLAHQHKPKMIVVGASAYSRLIDYARLECVACEVGAILFVDMAHISGLVAASVIPSPVPHADVVSSTTHKTLRGPRGGIILSKAEWGVKVDKAVMPGTQGGPFMHIIAAKAAAFEEALTQDFKDYQKQVVVNAQTMANTLHECGYRIISGGTDTHLFLVDVTSKKGNEALTGKEVEATLMQCGIVVNRNMIPFDKKSVLVTSGIRIGTPAITTRGFGQQEARELAYWINEAIEHRENQKYLDEIAQKVDAFCAQFPVYQKNIIPGKATTIQAQL